MQIAIGLIYLIYRLIKEQIEYYSAQKAWADYVAAHPDVILDPWGRYKK